MIDSYLSHISAHNDIKKDNQKSDKRKFPTSTIILIFNSFKRPFLNQRILSLHLAPPINSLW
jgi:hypothetical protein